jgi:cell division protein FtsI/penicillin-binding protein 2
MDPSIPSKANRVLNVIILSLFLILIRVWYLAIIQHDSHVAAARKPQRRSTIEKVERATIRDRFNIPLAINKIQYNAAVCYADIRQIPSVRWVKSPDGVRTKVYARSTYIKELSDLLAAALEMEAQVIEDTIHGKASLFPHTPFVIKENLSEDQFFRLKLLEKDWVGIRTERGSVRSYPQGRTGCDLIGYLGAISSKEYLDIAQEIKVLQSYLMERESGEMPVLPKGFQNPLEARERLKQLQEKSYTIHDLVGKMGVESYFDEELRGYFGKRIHEIDIKGNFIRELPGSRKAVPGQRLLLAISSELQEFAEQLLAHNEHFREVRNMDGSCDLSEPWIRGGAIVAMDPNTGEIVAMASYPRFDPNDFIPTKSSELKKQKHHNMLRWLENEEYVSEIWDGKRPLERERVNLKTQQFYDETLELNWSSYLEMILPKGSQLIKAVHQINNIGSALTLQKELDHLLVLSGQSDMRVLLAALYGEESHIPSRTAISVEEKTTARGCLNEHPRATLEAKQIIDAYLQGIPHHDDKLLVIDLCRIMVRPEDFSLELEQCIAQQSLAAYRTLCQSSATLRSYLQEHARAWFHNIDFQKWRSTHFKDFLKLKRKEEKDKKQYTRPYTDYLEQIEKTLFKEFWETHLWELTSAFILGRDLSASLQPYQEQCALLREKDPFILSHANKLKNVFQKLPEDLALSYLQTMRSFSELNRPLLGKYRSLRNTKGIQLEKHLAAAFYPLAGFGYGRSQAYRQSTPLGSVFKLLVGYQGMLEKYDSLGGEDPNFTNLNPLTIIDNIQWTAHPGSNAQVLGKTLDGETITRYYKGGRLPRTHPNIGKIDLIGAIEQSSNIYFSLLAAEQIEDPSHLIDCCRKMGFGERSGVELPGEIRGVLPNDLSYNKTGLYSFAIGQHSLVVTPLQTAMMLSAIANRGKILEPKIVQVIAGSQPSSDSKDPFDSPTFAFQDPLNLIGIDFALFSATQELESAPRVWLSSPIVKRTIEMPDEIREPLLQGMQRVMTGSKGTARSNIIRTLYENPEMRQHYQELKSQILGKTGTAEIMFKQAIDAHSLAEIRNHIWFSGISFSPGPKDSDPFNNPELVVNVYLRLSEAGGKEAAPLAVEVVKKWREIRAKQGRSSHVQ